MHRVYVSEINTSNSIHLSSCNINKARRRARFSDSQRDKLRKFFDGNRYPDRLEKQVLAKHARLTVSQVHVNIFESGLSPIDLITYWNPFPIIAYNFVDVVWKHTKTCGGKQISLANRL